MVSYRVSIYRYLFRIVGKMKPFVFFSNWVIFSLQSFLKYKDFHGNYLSYLDQSRSLQQRIRMNEENSSDILCDTEHPNANKGGSSSSSNGGSSSSRNTSVFNRKTDIKGMFEMDGLPFPPDILKKILEACEVLLEFNFLSSLCSFLA
jgi:hypothetical protein